MTTIEERKSLIEELKREIEPLQAQVRRLESELRRAESIEFIRVNNITRDDVAMSSGTGVPCFSDIISFPGWLKSSDKRFYESSGAIYYTNDLIAGRFRPTPGRVEDLPKKKENTP